MVWLSFWKKHYVELPFLRLYGREKGMQNSLQDPNPIGAIAATSPRFLGEHFEGSHFKMTLRILLCFVRLYLLHTGNLVILLKDLNGQLRHLVAPFLHEM